VAENDAQDWHAAIKGAAEKLERVLQHQLGKLEDKRR
jgi:ribosome-associated translation inhibitor RaiA